MPLYEYKCRRCEEVFEVIQKFADAPLEIHEGCGGSLERLVSTPALQFKGSGWYVTDYAKSGSRGEKNGSSGGADKGDKKESGAKDTAAKADTPAKTPVSSESSSK